MSYAGELRPPISELKHPMDGPMTTDCLHCERPLEILPRDRNTPDRVCGHCGARQLQFIYPAACGAAQDGYTPELLVEGASCFYHADVAADRPCDDCGRFVCTLCVIHMPEPASHPADFPASICPTCLAHRIEEEHVNPQWDLYRSTYPRHDFTAQILAVVPILLFPLFALVPVASGIVLYLAFRFGWTTRTPVRRYRGHMVAAAIVAVITLTIWIATMTSLIVREL